MHCEGLIRSCGRSNQTFAVHAGRLTVKGRMFFVGCVVSAPAPQQGPSGEHDMFQNILVPVDLSDPEFAKPAVETAGTLAHAFNAELRLIHVMPATPTLLAEFVPADFDAQQ